MSLKEEDIMTEEELQKAFKAMNRGQDKVHFVEQDEEFEFGCERCGSCCSNRNDIVVGPYDIYNMSIAKKVTSFEIIRDYIDIHIGGNSHLPVLTIKEGDNHLCPFLDFNITESKFNCSINDYKPGACEAFPFGAVRAIKKDTDEQIVRFIRTEFCNNHNNNKIKVGEYLTHYMSNEDKRSEGQPLTFFMAEIIDFEKIDYFLSKDYSKLNEHEISLAADAPDEVIEELRMIIYNGYLKATYDFDPSVPFLEQINTKKNEICYISVKIISIFELIGIDIKTKDTLKLVTQFGNTEDIELLIDLKNMRKAEREEDSE